MKCFEQKDYQSNLKNPQSSGGITNYTDSPEKQARLIKKDYVKLEEKMIQLLRKVSKDKSLSQKQKREIMLKFYEDNGI
tara:strand:+ start:463 stop:699 length:237 start_codon:yes stop_codon:yes gene_type:complete